VCRERVGGGVVPAVIEPVEHGHHGDDERGQRHGSDPRTSPFAQTVRAWSSATATRSFSINQDRRVDAGDSIWRRAVNPLCRLLPGSAEQRDTPSQCRCRVDGVILMSARDPRKQSCNQHLTSRPAQSAWQRVPGTATRLAQLVGRTRSSVSDDVGTGLRPLDRRKGAAAEGSVCDKAAVARSRPRLGGDRAVSGVPGWQPVHDLETRGVSVGAVAVIEGDRLRRCRPLRHRICGTRPHDDAALDAGGTLSGT
jgi:hypothetical protein